MSWWKRLLGIQPLPAAPSGVVTESSAGPDTITVAVDDEPEPLLLRHVDGEEEPPPPGARVVIDDLEGHPVDVDLLLVHWPDGRDDYVVWSCQRVTLDDLPAVEEPPAWPTA